MPSKLAEAFVEIKEKGIDHVHERISFLKEGLAGLIGGATGASLAISFEAVGEKIGEMFHDFGKNESAALRMNAAVKATGEAAGFSAKQLQDMAEKMGGDSIFSKADILNAQRTVMQIGNISGDNFTKTLTVGMDVAAAKGEDLESVMFRLARAVESPAEGAMFLTRMGVRLNEEQQKQIELMEKSGDTAGAQKIVLDKLGEAYAGSSEAMAKGWEGTLSRFGSSTEEAMSKIAEHFDLKGIFESGIHYLDYFTSHFDTAWDEIAEGAKGISTYLIESFHSFTSWIGNALGTSMNQVLPIMKGLATHLDDVWDVMYATASGKFLELRDFLGYFFTDTIPIVVAGANAWAQAFAKAFKAGTGGWYDELVTSLGTLPQYMMEHYQQASSFHSEFKNARDAEYPNEGARRAAMQAVVDKYNKMDDDLKKQLHDEGMQFLKDKLTRDGTDPADVFNRIFKELSGKEFAFSPETKKALDDAKKAAEKLGDDIAKDQNRPKKPEVDDKARVPKPPEDLSRHGKETERFSIDDLSKHIQAGALQSHEQQQNNIAAGIKKAAGGAFPVKVINPGALGPAAARFAPG